MGAVPWLSPTSSFPRPGAFLGKSHCQDSCPPSCESSPQLLPQVFIHCALAPSTEQQVVLTPVMRCPLLCQVGPCTSLHLSEAIQLGGRVGPLIFPFYSVEAEAGRLQHSLKATQFLNSRARM